MTENLKAVFLFWALISHKKNLTGNHTLKSPCFI